MIADFRSGFVAIVGKPNVGKSTLLNALVGEKIAIVSNKPETTRDKIIGIRHLPGAQICFVDTPGIFRPTLLLTKQMVRQATESLSETDLVVVVVQAFGLEEEDERVFQLLPKKTKTPVLLVINKVDCVKKERLLPMIERSQKNYPFREIIPISAKTYDQVDLLLKKIVEYLPQGVAYYPQEMTTDRDTGFAVRELIREKILEVTREEVPYSVAIVLEEMEERRADLLYLRATIFVERESQKGILIGEKGEMLKRIGARARRDLEEHVKRKVFLDLWVKVLRNWRKDPEALRRLGYLS